MDQQFKLAIALTNNEFRFAVNGQIFTVFKYRSERLLDVMNGFKVSCGNGLQLEVTGVDHMNMGQPECEGFETYSDPEIHLL
jgi:Galactoside-binding lectin